MIWWRTRWGLLTVLAVYLGLALVMSGAWR